MWSATELGGGKMDLGIISFVILIVIILIGFFFKINTGILAIAAALIVGRAGGISDGEIIEGFNVSLFVMILGTTYLFSMAQTNGTLHLFARKVLGLVGHQTKLIPITIYFLAIGLSAIAGPIPVMALMTLLSVSLSADIGVSPLLMASLSVLGAGAGAVSPLSPTGILASELIAAQEIYDIQIPYLINSILGETLYAAVLYVTLGGYRIQNDSLCEESLPAFNREQKLTLAGIGTMAVLVLVFDINVGLAAFGISVILSIFKVAKEQDVISNVPWGTLLLISGIGIYMSLVIRLGGTKHLTDMLSGVLTTQTAPSVMGVIAGVMSWFSSTSGVVIPTLFPMVGDLVEAGRQVLHPVELISAITNCSHAAGISPMSTGGALTLAAFSSITRSDNETQRQLFIKLFIVSACGIIFLAIVSLLGVFRIVL